MANQWYKEGQYWEPKWMENNAVARSQKREGDGIEELVAGRVMKNDSTLPVYYKPEGTGEALQLSQDVGLFGQAVDGVATPFRRNEVFKVPDGSKVIIKEGGEVVPDITDPGTIVIFPIKLESGEAGWKDRNWLKKIQDEDNDHSWDALFERAKTI